MTSFFVPITFFFLSKIKLHFIHSLVLYCVTVGALAFALSFIVLPRGFMLIRFTRRLRRASYVGKPTRRECRQDIANNLLLSHAFNWHSWNCHYLSLFFSCLIQREVSSFQQSELDVWKHFTEHAPSLENSITLLEIFKFLNFRFEMVFCKVYE